MESVTKRHALVLTSLWPRRDSRAVAVWVLAFVLPVYLALEGGGYDTVVRGQVGIAIWWAVLVGCVVGLLPTARPTWAGWGMLALLAAFAGWTLLSTTWSSSSERSVLESARIATHLGVLVLAVVGLRRDMIRHAVNALAAAVGLVAVLALLSRLHPSWFPAQQTGEFLPSVAGRLSYPLNYWNALGAFLAMGVPLLLYVASSARTIIARALAAAIVPVAFATIYLTYSRGAILALAVAVVVLVLTWPRRLTLVATIAVVSIGSLVLATSLSQRSELANAESVSIALKQGDQMVWLSLLVIAGCCLLQAAIVLVDRYVERPSALRVSRRSMTIAAMACVAVVAVAGVAAGGIGKASDEWSSFKRLDPNIQQREGNSARRLTAVSGNGRYQYWQSAAQAAKQNSDRGIGAGTFEYWWSQHGTIPGFIRNAHSLWMETFAELGWLGLALIVGLFGVPVAVGARALVSRDLATRQLTAAALAGVLAFCISASVDWVWQVTVLPVMALILCGALVNVRRDARPMTNRARTTSRVLLGILAVASLVLVALPLAGLTSVRESQAQVERNDFASALGRASTAQRVQPYAATPLLQEALVLERADSLDAAAVSARRATVAERENWRTWFVLSRIEAERGNAAASVEAYRRAKALNPRSSLFK